MPAVAAFAVALAAGSAATWWLTGRLAPCRAESRPRGRATADPVDAGAAGSPGAERDGACRRRAPWRTPVAPAAVQQPKPAAPPVPSAAQPAPVVAAESRPLPAAAAASPPPVAAADAADDLQPSPPQPPLPPLPPHAGNVPQWRLDRAEAAGRGARNKLDGRARRVPRTPEGPPGPKSIFVVARAVRGGAGPGIVASPWGGVRGYVTRQGDGGPAIHDDAVFHGFHSREEAECYWNAAFPGASATWLPPVP